MHKISIWFVFRILDDQWSTRKPSLFHIQSITHRRAPVLCQFCQCAVSSWLWRLALKSEEQYSLLAHGHSWTCHNFITIDKLHYNVLMCLPRLYGHGIQMLEAQKALKKTISAALNAIAVRICKTVINYYWNILIYNHLKTKGVTFQSDLLKTHVCFE